MRERFELLEEKNRQLEKDKEMLFSKLLEAQGLNATTKKDPITDSRSTVQHAQAADLKKGSTAGVREGVPERLDQLYHGYIPPEQRKGFVPLERESTARRTRNSP